MRFNISITGVYVVRNLIQSYSITGSPVIFFVFRFRLCLISNLPGKSNGSRLDDEVKRLITQHDGILLIGDQRDGCGIHARECGQFIGRTISRSVVQRTAVLERVVRVPGQALDCRRRTLLGIVVLVLSIASPDDILMYRFDDDGRGLRAGDAVIATLDLGLANLISHHQLGNMAAGIRVIVSAIAQREGLGQAAHRGFVNRYRSFVMTLYGDSRLVRGSVVGEHAVARPSDHQGTLLDLEAQHARRDVRVSALEVEGDHRGARIDVVGINHVVVGSPLQVRRGSVIVCLGDRHGGTLRSAAVNDIVNRIRDRNAEVSLIAVRLDGQLGVDGRDVVVLDVVAGRCRHRLHDDGIVADARGRRLRSVQRHKRQRVRHTALGVKADVVTIHQASGYDGKVIYANSGAIGNGLLLRRHLKLEVGLVNGQNAPLIDRRLVVGIQVSGAARRYSNSSRLDVIDTSAIIRIFVDEGIDYLLDFIIGDSQLLTVRQAGNPEGIGRQRITIGNGEVVRLDGYRPLSNGEIFRRIRQSIIDGIVVQRRGIAAGVGGFKHAR